MLLNNLAFAESLEPTRFSLQPDEEGTLLVPRNVVPFRHLVRGRFLYMPQNAWAWLGPGGGARESSHRLALRALSNLALRRATATLRISESIPHLAGPALPTLHNVLDPQFEQALAESQEIDADTDGSIVSVGSFVPYRNFERLIRAHEAYRRRGGRLRLVLAGPAPFASSLAHLRALARDRRDVELRPGRLSRARVVAMLRSCELAILPSLVEASPVSVLEALILCPRIAASDIQGHHGIGNEMLDPETLFDPTSEARICAALETAERPPSPKRALPISTPPNAIAYSSGMIKTGDMARAGLVVGLIGLILFLGISPAIWSVLGIT